MAVRRTSKSNTRKATTAAPGRDVTQYADKKPTDLHKTFARWIVTQVGYDPEAARSKREAFLMGVSISTVARNAFQGSDFLAAWYEEEGIVKRGRKPAGTSQTSSKARSKPAPEPEPEEEEEDDTLAEEMEEREEELKALTVAKLKAFAKSDCEATAADIKGLTKKSDLVEFILAFEFPEDEEEDADDEDDSDDDEDGEFEEREEELGEMTLAQLRTEAKELGATVKFLKGMTAKSIREWILGEEFPEDADDEDEDEESEEDFEDEDEDEADEEDEDEEEETPKSRRGRPSGKSSARTTKQPAAKGKAAGGAKDDYLF